MSAFSFDALSDAQLTEYEINKKSSATSLDSLEERIDEKISPRYDGREFNVVYCYLLKNDLYSYPNGESNILYIGSTIGELMKSKKRSLSYRFKHCKEGKDNKSNLCLRFFYEHGDVLILKIFNLEKTKYSCREKERELRRLFTQTYAARPIADGASYKK